jgi:5'-nucleotidase
MNAKPLVLVSNDDGFFSPGIRAIQEALREFADVVLVAPEHEQSASSHAISLHRSLRVKDHGPGVFSVDGTPADCVYVALYSGTRILPRTPDLVVSGINRGLNLGQDAFYSGTVAAAREGALRGIPGLALSAELGAELPNAAAIGVRLAREMLCFHSPPKTPLLSANIPKDWNGEFKAARLGRRQYDEVVFYRTDPRGREYLWLGGPAVEHKPDPGSDTEAFDTGFTTLTSLSLDPTETNDAGLAAQCAALASGNAPAL